MKAAIYIGGALLASALFATQASALTPLVYPYPGYTCPQLSYNLYTGLSDYYTGGQVSELQRFFSSRGYYQPVTGYFGTLTRANVAQFQREQGVWPVTGGVGPLTRAAILRLCSGYPYPTPTPTPNAITVTSPQQGAVYTSGQQATIAWTTGVVSAPYLNTQGLQVQLDLYSINGTSVGTIAISPNLYGSYNWSIPTGGTICTLQYPNGLCGQYLQGQYFIKATVMQNGVQTASGNSGTFTINQQTQSGTLTVQPTSGYRPLTTTFTIAAPAGNYTLTFGDGQSQFVAVPAIMCVTTPCNPPTQ